VKKVEKEIKLKGERNTSSEIKERFKIGQKEKTRWGRPLCKKLG